MQYLRIKTHNRDTTLKSELFCSLDIMREYVVEFDDEKICASFDVYSVLQAR